VSRMSNEWIPRKAESFEKENINNNDNPQSIDSGNVYARPTTLSESHHRRLWSLQITITLTENDFFAI